MEEQQKRVLGLGCVCTCLMPSHLSLSTVLRMMWPCECSFFQRLFSASSVLALMVILGKETEEFEF